MIENGHTLQSLKDRQRQVREDAILDAANDLIAAHGYDAMTMDDLANQVGISKPTLYQHFASKEMVAVRAMVRMIQCSRDYMASLDPQMSGYDQLENVMCHMIEKRFIEKTPPFGSAKAELVPVIKDHEEYKAVSKAAFADLCALVDRAKREGTVEKTLSTRIIAQLLVSVMRDAQYEDLLASGECTAQELIKTLVTIVLIGTKSGARKEVPCD